MEDKITLDPTTPRELQEEIDHTKTESGAMSMVCLLYTSPSPRD